MQSRLRRDENRRHIRGYVENFRESLMRKRSVQIESKIAQFRLNRCPINRVFNRRKLVVDRKPLKMLFSVFPKE